MCCRVQKSAVRHEAAQPKVRGGRMRRNIILYKIISYYTINIVLCHVMLSYVMLCQVMLYDNILYNNMMMYYTNALFWSPGCLYPLFEACHARRTAVCWWSA